MPTINGWSVRPWLKDTIDESVSPNWALQLLPLKHGRGPFFCLRLAFKDHSFLVFHTCCESYSNWRLLHHDSADGMHYC